MTEKEREILMKHYLNPKNRNMPHDNYEKVNSRNESCIDNINLYIKWNKDILEDIVFDGEACAISIASTSIMIENLIGKTKKEAEEYINNFTKMLQNEDCFLPKEAEIFKNIPEARKICATLPYIGIKKAILKK